MCRQRLDNWEWDIKTKLEQLFYTTAVLHLVILKYERNIIFNLYHGKMRISWSVDVWKQKKKDVDVWKRKQIIVWMISKGKWEFLLQKTFKVENEDIFYWTTVFYMGLIEYEKIAFILKIHQLFTNLFWTTSSIYTKN